MRHPIHWIKAKETRPIPCTPGKRVRVCPARGRSHECPPAQDDEDAHRMETEPGDLEPNSSQNSYDACAEAAPIGWWELSMFEVGSEKMKVNDPKNGQC